MDQNMSAKSSLCSAFAIIITLVSLALPAKGLCLATESPRAVIDSLTPIAVMVFPMEYSYDAAGNRTRRTVQIDIIPSVFPPVIDTLAPIEPPVGGGTIHP